MITLKSALERTVQSVVTVAATITKGLFVTLGVTHAFYFNAGVSGDDIVAVLEAEAVRVPLKTGDSPVAGAILYYHTTNLEATVTATGAVLCLVALEPAASATTEGLLCRFDGKMAYLKT